MPLVGEIETGLTMNPETWIALFLHEPHWEAITFANSWISFVPFVGVAMMAVILPIFGAIEGIYYWVMIVTV